MFRFFKSLSLFILLGVSTPSHSDSEWSKFDPIARLGIEVEISPEFFSRLLPYYDLHEVAKALGDPDFLSKTPLEQAKAMQDVSPFQKFNPEEFEKIAILKTNAPDFLKSFDLHIDGESFEFSTKSGIAGVKRPFEDFKKLLLATGLQEILKLKSRIPGMGYHYHMSAPYLLNTSQLRQRTKQMNRMILMRFLSLDDDWILTAGLVGYKTDITERGTVRFSTQYNTAEIRTHYLNAESEIQQHLTLLTLSDEQFQASIQKMEAECLDLRPDLFEAILKKQTQLIFTDFLDYYQDKRWGARIRRLASTLSPETVKYPGILSWLKKENLRVERSLPATLSKTERHALLVDIEKMHLDRTIELTKNILNILKTDVFTHSIKESEVFLRSALLLEIYGQSVVDTNTLVLKMIETNSDQADFLFAKVVQKSVGAEKLKYQQVLIEIIRRKRDFSSSNSEAYNRLLFEAEMSTDQKSEIRALLLKKTRSSDPTDTEPTNNPYIDCMRSHMGL